MITVFLIDLENGNVISETKTDRAEWTIRQMMKNRDPRKFAALVA